MDSECVCVCVCVHVAFTNKCTCIYMIVHSQIHTGREGKGGGRTDDSEGDEERERKGGVYMYISSVARSTDKSAFYGHLRSFLEYGGI